MAKFEDNVARDRLKEQELRFAGWEVLTIWECNVDYGFNSVLRRLMQS